MTAYRKKLIEVALPLVGINEESSLRKRKAPGGYPTTLHKWWAQRPLAACRAVLFASLVDDPGSDPTFRKADGRVDEDRAGVRRAELFNLIEQLVLWENSINEKVLNAAKAEIAASIASRKVHDTKEWKKEQLICSEKAWTYVCRLAKPPNVDAFLAEHAPQMLDPFCGGGSIPLEAQRLGLRALGTDLNPVPVLITKALIELPAKCANRTPVNPESANENGMGNLWIGAAALADDVRFYGNWIREEAVRRIGHLYPKVRITPQIALELPQLKQYIGQEFPVVAWFWARTVESPDPASARSHVPLVSSFWLSTKKESPVWIEANTDRSHNSYTFSVRYGVPPAERRKAIGSGTKIGRGCKFRCLLSGQPIPEEHIKLQGCEHKLGTRLMAIAVDGPAGRIYLSPTAAQENVIAIAGKIISGLDAPIADDKRALWCTLYGLNTFASLFTARQLTALDVLSGLVHEARDRVLADGEKTANGSDIREYADAVAIYLAFAVSRAADYNSTLASWRPKDNAMRSSLAKQGLPMIWDFAEANPFAKSSAGYMDCVKVVAKCLEFLPVHPPGKVAQLDATKMAEGASGPLICTDPPYYDNIGYADLSDFLYVWLRKCLSWQAPSLFSTVVTPKSQELIASPYRHAGDRERATMFFEAGLESVFERACKVANRDYPVTVFYAFKQTESDDDGDDNLTDPGVNAIASTGWETILNALINAGFCITGTWPMRTEGDNRQVGIGANALASSIVLVCRPRPGDAPLATRREFLNSLKRDLPDSLTHLQRGNIAPVDLAQAAIGPGMAVFTRYAKVMEADGSPMKVRQALALINQTLDEVLAEQEGEFDGDTRWALAWFEQFGMDEGAFGIAETLSKAKNTAVNGLVDAGLIAARSGKVRLLKRDELPKDWNPATDNKVRHWEVAQHLIRALETGGEIAAADLLRRVGGLGEVARDLAYRLYNLCERKKWANEALAYNGLVIAWPEISKLARNLTPATLSEQGALF
jgi:putative DNA methylase